MGRDTAVALGLIALAGLYWLGADQIRASRLEGIVGAQAVPKGLAVTLGILSALLVVQDLWRGRRRARAGVVETPAPEEPEGMSAHGRAFGMLLIGAAYLGVVGFIGYLPAIALLILATALYTGRPWSPRVALIAVGGAALYYLLFVRLLGIPLPPGFWPGVWRGLLG